MTGDFVIAVTNEMLWTAIMIGAFPIGASLIVSLIISVFQVATQIQEMSLTFVPKILTVAVTLMVMGGWMLGRLVSFSRNLIANIPSYF